MATEDVTIKSSDTPINGYLARPTGQAKGGLLVVHEIWGLNDHTKDVARRFADQGYLTLAPDLISGTEAAGLDPAIFTRMQDPATRDEAQKEMRAKTAPLQSPEFAKTTLVKLEACFKYLADQPETGGRVAIVGFCFGGTYAFALATAQPKLVAAVPFYGHADHPTEELKQITCPVLAFYGEEDTNLTEQLPELVQKMEAAGRNFTHKVYPGTGHAFFNDSNPNRYNEAAATDAWKLTLDFLDQAFGA